MTQQNTILKKYNGASYDNVYPATKASDVKCTNPFTQQASNLQDTIDYMVEMKKPKFTLYHYDKEESYSFDIGMTWRDWVSSTYNTTEQSSITTFNKIGIRADGNVGYYYRPDFGFTTDILVQYNDVNVSPDDLITLSARYYVEVGDV